MKRESERPEPDAVQVVGDHSPEGRERRRAPRPGWVVAAVVGLMVIVLAVMRFDATDGGAAAGSTTTTRADEGTLEEPWWVTSVDPGPAVTLAGWERLDPGPIGGLVDLAAAWTGSEIFVWGGTDRLYGSEFHPVLADPGAHLFDPSSGAWRSASPMPDGMCRVWGSLDAIPAGEVVIVRYTGEVRGGCTTIGAYDPAGDTWEPLRNPFFVRATPGKPLVWTGRLFVSPRDGLAYDWGSGETFDIPRVPGSPTIHGAHWTDSLLVAATTSGVATWAPGDDAWRIVDDAPSVVDFEVVLRGSSWTAHGLLVVDEPDGPRFFDGAAWRSTSLPASHMCGMSVVDVEVPVLRSCLGLLLWEERRRIWVPVPAPSLDGVGLLIDGGGELYAVGRPGLHRLALERDAGGAVVGPPTVPIGWAYLEVPDGFVIAGHGGAVPLREADESEVLPGFPLHLPVVETRWMRFDDEGSRMSCTVTASVHFSGDPGGGDGEGVDVVVARPGLVDLTGRVSAGPDGAVAVDVDGWSASYFGWDLYRAACGGGGVGAGEEEAATGFVAGLWSPDEARFLYSFTGDGEGPGDDFFPQGDERILGFFQGVPDSERSGAAEAGFRACVAETMGDGLALAGLRLLVDADGRLLQLLYSGVRAEARPPVAVVPEGVRDDCLRQAGVVEPLFEVRG